MLKLVLGRAGSGKTRFTLDKAAEIMQSGGNAVIVVPEQFTFETERSLLRAIGPESCLNIEVLSFSRMVHRVMGVYGGFAGRYIDDCGRYIIMHIAIKQVADLLNVYRRQAQYPAFIKTMVETTAEYKLCGVTPDIIDDAVSRADDALLRRKLEDISLIMRTYDALLENGFRDASDDLTRLANELSRHKFFEGRTVIIDAFKGFTAQEKTVLKEILSQAKDVYITLCTDKLDDDESGYGLFSPVRKTGQELIMLANRAYVPVAKPEILDVIKRFEPTALYELERRIFRPQALKYEKTAPEIHIISASNIYDEAQFAAQEIARLIREEGVRCRDIVVISRGLELYRGILDPAFEKYGIPLFFDTRRDIETHPLMTLLLCALEIITTNFRFEPVFRYLKSGLAGFDMIEISLVENYVLTWDIRGDAWKSEWQGNPEGFAGGMGEQVGEQLLLLNNIRSRFVEPLLAFSKALEAAPDAQGMVAALYCFLIELGADKTVMKIYENLIDTGEVELADEYRQIWDKLINIFNQSQVVLKDTRLTNSELYELLHLAIANTELAHIPPSLDEVTAGDAERIRAGDAKYAFVIGLADGIFPKTQSSGGVITDTEREKLISLGLELSPPAQQRIVEERFIAYKAFTCASKGIYLTCPRSDTSGRVMRPSYFLLSVKALFPQCDVRDEALGDGLESIQNEKSAYELMALRYNDRSQLEWVLRDYFKILPEYKGRLSSLDAAANKKPALLRDRALARSLFGERMHISPSRLESFEQCRFLYFCRYGLRARPRRKAEMMAPEIGTLIHFVLEKLLSSEMGKKLTEISKEELYAEIDRLLDEFANDYLGGLEDKPERFKYLFLRLRETVVALVEHIAQELASSDFIPVDFELAIQNDGEVKPVVIDLPDGGSIAVEGKVDRVDIMKRGSKTYLRVIDYKSGAKTFNLQDVVYGLNLQMFIYLFSLCDNAALRYSAQELLPAGVLYMPARRPEISAQRGEEEQSINSRINGALKMSGLITDEPEVIKGMEHDAKGIFIPARLKENAQDDGSQIDLRSSVASLEQFGVIKRHIENTLRCMAQTLREGDVAALPVEGLGYKPCGYCEFSSVCGFEKGDAVRYLRNTKNVWDDLKGGGADDGKALD